MPSQLPSLMQSTPEEARKTPPAAAEDTQWSRPECQAWTGMLLLGTCLLYCARVTMPVCTVAMSQDFGWNKKEAGIVLSSFFWGYCLTQVVGGHLGDRIGGEKVILLSASTWGFITAVTPLLAHLGNGHLAFMTFSRILTGLLQGVYFPALASLLSQRVPEGERAFTYGTVGAGSQFGFRWLVAVPQVCDNCCICCFDETTDKKQIKKTGFALAHSLRVQSIVKGSHDSKK